jgi:hypothetical protein
VTGTDKVRVMFDNEGDIKCCAIFGDLSVVDLCCLIHHVASQRGREVSVGKLQCFGEELLVPSGALSLSLEAVGGGMMP